MLEAECQGLGIGVILNGKMSSHLPLRRGPAPGSDRVADVAHEGNLNRIIANTKNTSTDDGLSRKAAGMASGTLGEIV